MSGDGDSRCKSAREVLDAWREQRADRMDPVRFRFIEVLESRTSRHGGEVRRILDQRLSKLVEIYADDLAGEPFREENLDSAKPARETIRGVLGGLLQHIDDHKVATTGGVIAANGPDVGADDPLRPSSAELPALHEFRKIWSKVRNDGQLRQSLEQVPANAGPLNSGTLVHRSITLMQELSPGYLQHFLSYVDTLAGMEQMHGDGVLVMETSRAVGSNKHPRSKPRKRRD